MPLNPKPSVSFLEKRHAQQGGALPIEAALSAYIRYIFTCLLYIC